MSREINIVVKRKPIITFKINPITDKDVNYFLDKKFINMAYGFPSSDFLNFLAA